MAAAAAFRNGLPRFRLGPVTRAATDKIPLGQSVASPARPVENPIIASHISTGLVQSGHLSAFRVQIYSIDRQFSPRRFA